MLSSYFLPFISSLTLSFLLTLLVRRLALKFDIIDRPKPPRKLHRKPIPLLGGLAIFLSFFIILTFYTLFTKQILYTSLLGKHLLGLFIGGLFLMIGGFLDDKYELKPHYQVIWPLLAVAAVVISGMGIKFITSPLGGLFHLDTYKIKILTFGGLPYYFTVLADLFTFVWLFGMMYTTKFLDGLDGLVSGITVIGALVIFGLSVFTKFYQEEIATLSIILAGAALGFLILNFHPAKIFLGEGGSIFCGFMLGTLAIISGGKIATTLLVMGIPILDVAWVILRRIFWERRSPVLPDRKHLHFRLLEVGFTQRQTVLFLYLLGASFGITTLFLQGFGKLVALSLLAIVMLILAVSLVIGYKKLKIKN